MKQFTLIATFILTTVLFMSCKKDISTTQAPVPATNTPATSVSKIAKMETTDGSYAITYAYDANGRLKQTVDNNYKINYSYASTPFGYEIFEGGKAQKAYDITEAINSNGRLSHFLYRGISTTGTVNWADTTDCKFDSNGYQVQKLSRHYLYTFDVVNGNTTKLVQKDMITGKIIEETTLEYYTDKKNKLNLNVFEYLFFDQILSDNELFGSKNINLIKKAITKYPASTYVYDMSYVLDSDGKISTYTNTYTENGGAPQSYTYKLSYQ